MAHKKGSGSTKNGRDSRGKRLGLKVAGGDWAFRGSIILRQRGMKFSPGKNVRMGRDYTLYSIDDGIVTFSYVKKGKKKVNVIPRW